MWMIHLTRYWSQLLLALLLSFSLLGWTIANNKLHNAETERDQYKSALDFQNATLLNDAKKYEERLKQLPKEIEKIKTRYVAVYDGIDNYKEDDNATKCENAFNFLDSFNY